jgi:hypothetical protein
MARTIFSISIEQMDLSLFKKPFAKRRFSNVDVTIRILTLGSALLGIPEKNGPFSPQENIPKKAFFFDVVSRMRI